LEVRFIDEEGIREQVRTAVEEALLAEGLVRSSAPRGRSAPDQAEISPGEPDDPGGSETSAGGSTSERALDAERGTGSGGVEQGIGPSAAGLDGTTTDRRAASETAQAGQDASEAERPDETGSPDTDAGAPTGGDREQAPGAVDAGGRKFSPPLEQERLGEADGAETHEFESLPATRVLGQLHDTYIVVETADGLVLVDQHAADERVNYERLREAFDGGVATQALAEPVELSLTAGEADLFEAHADALARLGFRAERVDNRTVAVRTVPTLVAEAADPDLLRDVLAEFVAGDRDPGRTVEAAAEELLADLACYPSVTGNTSLTEGSVLDLLSALDACENPYACPHGRPVVIELDREELEARFERDYPGHR
jgi:DNA mismatch repair protein MutL